MAIDVTCPACHTRFQVSDKFAGKSGPCPKCKSTIKIPEAKDQVVIHAPENYGPKDSKGQAVLKPLARIEVLLTRVQILAIAASVVAVLIAALVLRIQFQGKDSQQLRLIAALGAILLGPPLAFAAYTFLRDDELEPYRGTEVLLRSAICGLVYAAIWGAYWLVFWYLGMTPNWYVLGGVAIVMVGIGAVAAQASFELELGNGAFHYAMYLVATMLLRLILGMDAAWNVEPAKPPTPARPAQKAEWKLPVSETVVLAAVTNAGPGHASSHLAGDSA